MAELLGRDESGSTGLTPADLALTKETSITILAVSGKLESVLDVRDPKNLVPFVNLVRDFSLTMTLRTGNPIA